jgi:hypothetical protein
MSSPHSVLEWVQGDPLPEPPNVRIERFKPGIAKTIILLGDVVTRDTHWDREIRSTVPCFKPAACPMCSDARWVKTLRREGYAPALVANEKTNHWEQAVAVFTAGGLNQLSEAPHRGRILRVKKNQNGMATPMEVKEIEPFTGEFPLPPVFSVKAVMLRVWFPHIVHEEEVVFFEPIPFERRLPKTRPTHDEMELSADELLALADRLDERDSPAMAAKARADAEAKRTGKPIPASPPSPPPSPTPRREAATAAAGSSPATTRAARPSMVPDPDAAAEALRLRVARQKPASELTAGEAVEIGRIIDFVVGDKLPATIPLPSANGHPAKKGGVA